MDANTHDRLRLRRRLMAGGSLLLMALIFVSVLVISGQLLRGARIDVEGDLDLRGALGLDDAAPVGFKAIRIRFTIDAPEPDERLAELVRITRERCVVFRTLACEPQVSVSRA